MENSLDERTIRPTDLMEITSKLHNEDLQMFRANEMITVNCPACSSNTFQFQFTKKIFDFVWCDKCRTVFINPRPTHHALEVFYTTSKSMAYWNEIYKRTESIRKEKIFKPRIKLVIEILKKFGIKKCSKLVEVGSGPGWFCELAIKEKMADRIIAVEPSHLFADACRKIRGIEVVEAPIEKCSDKLDSDVIVNFELIEHLFDPCSFLKSCYNGLKTKGVFICSTPNFYGLDIQILREKSDNVDGPNHLNYFNPISIELLLSSIGFRNIEVITPGLMDTHIILNKIKSENLKDDRYILFNMMMEKNDENLINEFQALLQKYKMSSHMVVSAQK